MWRRKTSTDCPNCKRLEELRDNQLRQIAYYSKEVINYMKACKSLSVGMQRMSQKMETLKKKYATLETFVENLVEKE